jgi:hypothetical protein
VSVRKQIVVAVCALATMAAGAACTSSGAKEGNPALSPRGTTMTTVKPTRQDLTNRVSLAGKVIINPVFGLVAPVAGEVRYLDVRPPRSTPTKPTRVATVWAGGKPNHVEVPAGAMFSGRLVDDRSTVTPGMPIVSAKHIGYGIVAEIDGGQAYKIADAVNSAQAQIKNGPGPFACTVLGTIAALPAGTIPEPPPPSPAPNQPGQPPGQSGPLPGKVPGQDSDKGSDATGLRLVCTAPADVKLINGATAALEVVTDKSTNAMVLPVEAVAGSQGKGKVDVVKPDGTRETRDVVLGLTDGKFIEIKSGLAGDETIAIPGPSLPTAPVGPNGPGGPGGPGGPYGPGGPFPPGATEGPK